MTYLLQFVAHDRDPKVAVRKVIRQLVSHIETLKNEMEKINGNSLS